MAILYAVVARGTVVLAEFCAVTGNTGAVANDTFGRRIPFSYLEDIYMRFMKNYGRVAHYTPAFAMNDEFSGVLHQQMEFFYSNPSADTLNRVRDEVSEICTIMVDKIEKILQRGDRIELLVDKTAPM